MHAWESLSLGLLQGPREAFVFAGDPLGLDEEPEALVEGQRRHVGLVLLFGPGGGHGGELERVELVSWSSVGALSIGAPLLVVVPATDVFVDGGQGELRRGRGRCEPIEAVLEDRIDVTVGAGLDRADARAGGLEPLRAVALGQAQDAVPAAPAGLRGAGLGGRDGLGTGRGEGARGRRGRSC